MAGVLDVLLRVIPFSNAGLELITRGKWQAGTGIELADDPTTGRTLITATGSVAAISPLTTKGDLYGFTTADARIPVGTNGHVLTADSTLAAGIKWAAPSATVAAHATSHEDGGADELDGGALAYASSPANYTAATDIIADHFAGVDTALGTFNIAKVLGIGSAAGGADLTGVGTLTVTVEFTPPSYNVAGAPDATLMTGSVIYVTDGDAGSPCLAVSNGTNWLRIALGTAIASS